MPAAAAVKGPSVFRRLMANPKPAGQSDSGPRRKSCGKPPLPTQLVGSSGVLIDRRRWPSNPDQQLFCCTDPLDQRSLPPPVWLRRLTASNPIDTTIDVCASTSGSIAWGPRCWHARCSVSRRAVIGPGTVNTSRGHDGGRCDHDTGGWHDDAGTLIGVVPATADDLGGIGLNPSHGRYNSKQRACCNACSLAANAAGNYFEFHIDTWC